MRIAIDGAHGTGKTTLLHQLRPELKSAFTFIGEASRVVAPTFGVRSTNDWESLLSNPDRLELFFQAEEAWVIEREDRSEDFVIDSSIWQIAAYRTLYGARSNLSLALSRGYDLILNCLPPELGEIEDDGFRFLGGQRDVDDIYRRLLAEHYEGPVVPLPFSLSRVGIAVTEIKSRLG